MVTQSELTQIIKQAPIFTRIDLVMKDRPVGPVTQRRIEMAQDHLRRMVQEAQVMRLPMSEGTVGVAFVKTFLFKAEHAKQLSSYFHNYVEEVVVAPFQEFELTVIKEPKDKRKIVLKGGSEQLHYAFSMLYGPAKAQFGLRMSVITDQGITQLILVEGSDFLFDAFSKMVEVIVHQTLLEDD